MNNICDTISKFANDIIAYQTQLDKKHIAIAVATIIAIIAIYIIIRAHTCSDHRIYQPTKKDNNILDDDTYRKMQLKALRDAHIDP